MNVKADDRARADRRARAVGQGIKNLIFKSVNRGLESVYRGFARNSCELGRD